ncbi:MAG TPA: helix-turn-helix transcriptional regulator [Blastocatellia bacterium]|nr:helix-turn-helix transcriptional regulator [Blastocatellia bacterium]
MFQAQAFKVANCALLSGLFRRELSDLSQIHPEAVIASSRDLGWHSIRVLHVRYPNCELELPPLENHCVILSLGPHGSPPHSLSPDTLAIVPAGAPFRLLTSRPQEALHLYLSPQFVQQTAEICHLNHGQIAIEPQVGIRDEHLSSLAMSLFHELNEENAAGELYADSVAFVIALQLIRRYSSLNGIRISKGGMAPQKLRRAIEYIGDHLDQEQGIALPMVAEEVGMSYYHFSRAFKQSMGLSPINYVTRRRMERAQRLLIETEMPIAEIALKAGFSSQSHFTTSFRRLAGITPSSFRKHRKI